MGTRSRESIYGASIRASAERAQAARKEADRLACEAWNQRMLGYKGPAQPSPALGDALNAGYLYLEVGCLGCDTHQTVALNIVRRPKATPIHELERYMRCKDCSQVRGSPYKRSHLVALRATKISTTTRHPLGGRENDKSKSGAAKARESMSSRMAWLGAVVLGAIFATNADAQTVTKKLQGYLTIEDASKERLDCYDGVVPPDPKPKPPIAKVVADCKFLKEKDERLGCFNRFLVKPARPAADRKGAPKVEPSAGWSSLG